MTSQVTGIIVSPGGQPTQTKAPVAATITAAPRLRCTRGMAQAAIAYLTWVLILWVFPIATGIPTQEPRGGMFEPPLAHASWQLGQDMHTLLVYSIYAGALLAIMFVMALFGATPTPTNTAVATIVPPKPAEFTVGGDVVPGELISGYKMRARDLVIEGTAEGILSLYGYIIHSAMPTARKLAAELASPSPGSDERIKSHRDALFAAGVEIADMEYEAQAPKRRDDEEQRAAALAYAKEVDANIL